MNSESNKQKVDVYTLDCLGSTAELLRPKKRQKLEQLSTVTLGYMYTRKGSKKSKDFQRFRVLFDSGCGATLINKSLTKKLISTMDKQTKWSTKGGEFKTSSKCKVKFSLPAFHQKREIQWNCYVDETPIENCKYDMIIGRDLLHEVGIDLLFQTGEMVWDNASVPMQSPECLEKQFINDLEHDVFLADPSTTLKEFNKFLMQNILKQIFTR